MDTTEDRATNRDPVAAPVCAGTRFIGLDLETTGLDGDCLPLELGMIAFDDSLNETDTFHALILPADFTELYTSCAPSARSMHHASGLWHDLAQLNEDDAGSGGSGIDAVEHRAIAWLDRHTGDPSPFMLGTNIEFDRKVLHRTMPDLLGRFHYQYVDANSFKLIARHTYSALPPAGCHQPAHRVLADVRESIALIGDSLEGITARKPAAKKEVHP